MMAMLHIYLKWSTEDYRKERLLRPPEKLIQQFYFNQIHLTLLK